MLLKINTMFVTRKLKMMRVAWGEGGVNFVNACVVGKIGSSVRFQYTNLVFSVYFLGQ